jgi:hypothetical protein
VAVTSWRIAIVTLALCLLASGCGGGGHAKPSTHPRKVSELSWLRGYARWSERLRRDIGAAAEHPPTPAVDRSGADVYEAAVQQLESCERRYRDYVGEPPKAALRHPAGLALKACQGHAHAEQTYLAAVGHDGRSSLAAAETETELASQDLIVAEIEFKRTFLWNRPVPHVGGITAKSRIEPFFGRVATPIAGRPVQIGCWSSRDWPKVLAELDIMDFGQLEPKGFVMQMVTSQRANLSPATCASLVRLAYRQFYPRAGFDFYEMADAVETLSHEIQHLVDFRNEADTECYAMQSVEQVARGLGAPRTYARALAVEYWTYWYPTNDPEYSTDHCHDGGPLDAHPEITRWP